MLYHVKWDKFHLLPSWMKHDSIFSLLSSVSSLSSLLSNHHWLRSIVSRLRHRIIATMTTAIATITKGSSVTNMTIGNNQRHQQQQQQQQHRPQSILYDLCLEMKWDQVVSYDRNHDNVANSNRTSSYIDSYYQDNDSYETPLYVACQNHPPLDVIQCLIQWNPYALYTPRSRVNGDIPIHTACQYHNVSYEVLRYLLQSHIATVCQPNKWGNTPLGLLWNHLRPSILISIHHHGDNDNHNRHNHSTNHMNRYDAPHDIAEYQHDRHPRRQPRRKQTNRILHYDTTTNNMIAWKKIDLLLIAIAYYHRQKNIVNMIRDHHNNNGNMNHNNDTMPLQSFLSYVEQYENNNSDCNNNPSHSSLASLLILHGVVSLGSISYPADDILPYVIRKYPYQVYQRDDYGRLPFHIVISHILGQYVAIVNDHYDRMMDHTTTGSHEHNNNNKLTTTNQEYHWSSRCRRILSQYPQEGYVISMLLDLYPDATMIPDPNEPIGRYPLHTALINRHGSTRYDCPNHHKNNDDDHDHDDDDESNGSSIMIIMSYTPTVVLQYRDPIYRLYPYQLAACSSSIATTTNPTTSRSATIMDLDTTYRLLRMDPSVLSLR